MTNNRFEVDNFGVNNRVVKMYFKDNDITLTIGRNTYYLEANESSIIEYDLATSAIVNKDAVFIFVTSEGLRSQYFLFQLVNLKGILDAIKEFAEGSLSEDNIKIDKSTEELMEQIMKYHKEELINSHLETGNYDELKKLSLIL